MKIFIYHTIWVFLFCVSSAHAQELYLHNEPASSIPKGVLGIRAFLESFHEVKVQRAMGALRLMYGLTPKFSLMVTATASNHHGKTLPKDLITHTHIGNQTIYYAQPVRKGVSYPYRFNGFYVYAKYRFLTLDKQNEHFRMALYGEWSNVNQAHDEAEPNLLDDTKGYGGGFITTYLKNHFAVSLTTGFIVSDNYEETVPVTAGSSLLTHIELQYGRAIKYNLSLGYLLYPRRYKDYNQTNWNIYLEFIGRLYEGAKVFQDGQELETRSFALKKGNYIEIHPGIQKIIDSDLRIDFSVGFNLINKSYIHFYPLYMIGVQRYFFGGLRHSSG